MIKRSDVQVGSKVVNKAGKAVEVVEIEVVKAGRGRPAINYICSDGCKYKGLELFLAGLVPEKVGCLAKKPTDMPVQAYDYIKHMHPRLFNAMMR